MLRLDHYPMSDHADTIREYIRYSHNAGDTRDDAYAALDSMVAEVEQLRAALERLEVGDAALTVRGTTSRFPPLPVHRL